MTQENDLQQHTKFVPKNCNPELRRNILRSLEFLGPTFTLSIGLKKEKNFVISGEWTFRNGSSIYMIENEEYRDDEFIVFVQYKYANFLLEEIADSASCQWVPPPLPQAPCPSDPWFPPPLPQAPCPSGQWVPPTSLQVSCASGSLVPPPSFPPQAPCAQSAKAQQQKVIVWFETDYREYDREQKVLRSTITGRIIDDIRAGTYRVEEKGTHKMIDIELREVLSDDSLPPPAPREKVFSQIQLADITIRDGEWSIRRDSFYQSGTCVVSLNQYTFGNISYDQNALLTLLNILYRNHV